MNQVKFFKGCLPQILLGPFLNTLSQVSMMEFFAKKNVWQGSEKYYTKHQIKIISSELI